MKNSWPKKCLARVLVYVRASLLLFFALVWISACLGCGVRPSPELPHRALAAQLAAETVALVRLYNADGVENESGTPHIYCAGVFVSKTVIVTAEHCVAFLGMSPDRLALHEADEDSELPHWNPIGQRARYSLQGDSGYFNGVVLADDPDDDLGAIRVSQASPHAYARLSVGAIEPGDRLELVGHPAGYGWSYAEGLVSATRFDLTNVHGYPMLTLQISGPMSPGCSGSGAFDIFGRLVGIGSYINNRANTTGFYVHRDAVRQFLHGAGVL
jgi:S1-C subfamily serine protease